jgi:hypothetical protein
MSAYRDALSINADSSDERLELAAQILAAGTGVVMVNDTVALRPTSTGLLCEVVDPSPSSRRCEHEFEQWSVMNKVQIERPAADVGG